MKKILVIMLAFLILRCQAQTDPKFNLGFEKLIPASALSEGWIKWGTYSLSIDSLSNSGKRAGKISSTPDGQFGSIAYRIPANYSGKFITLEGYMKIKNVENGFAGLLLRVDGENQALAFSNMQDQHISGTKDWQKYSITLQYNNHAKNIFVGGILTGKGEAWFDDFKLSIDGNDIQTLAETEKPVYKADLDKEFDHGSRVTVSELPEKSIQDLALLGRIWGFLKYYHPKIAKGDYNWDYELFRIMPRYLGVSNTKEREELLLQWIDGLGETEECKTCVATSANAVIKPNFEWITTGIRNELLREKLQLVYKNRNQGSNFYVSMSPGVGNPLFDNENAYSNMPYPDAGFRVLALFRYWNMINYFYPYKHLMDKNWEGTLTEYLPAFISAKNELEYEKAMAQIIGDIQDTHANLWGGNDKMEEWKGNNFAPVHLRFIEGKLVVDDYYNPELKAETGLEIGDVITRIDGKKIQDIVGELASYYPASNKATRLRDISADMLRSQKSELEIEYLQNETLKTKKVKLYPRNQLNIYRYKSEKKQSYRLLDNNIGYVTLQSIKEEDIPKIIEEFENTKGIIIDIRNYPSTFVPFKLGTFFVSNDTPFVKFTNGNVKNPGEFTFTPALVIAKPEKTYRGKLIVLVNEFSQSQAEYTAMAFRAGASTKIVGSTTAGADGNVSTIMLPGGLRTLISGIGVYYPDGKCTQRVGIVPDIVVEPTIKGIKNGKDELMEKAIELILGQKEVEKV
jgi:C-terminal processing protease CtpA/Prc